MTGLDLITDALILTGALAQGETPGANDAADAFRRLNRMVSLWKNQRLTCYVVEENVYPLVGSQQEYTIGPGGDFDQFRPQWLSYCDLILANTSPVVSIKVNIITVKDWSFQSVKAQTSTQPTQVYYYTQFPQTGADAGLGKLIFWPTPTHVNSVRLYCPRGIDAFADLSTDYSFPPGYEDALEYNLAVRLIQAGMGLRSNLSDIAPMAKETLGVIKRANIQPVVASIDPALWPSQPKWNWRIGGPNTGGA
jgi:hypothetical protein